LPANAGCQHNTIAGDQIPDHLPLAAAEAGLALFVEDKRYIDPGAIFDLVVAVVELALQLNGQPTTDRRLPRPHRADKKDVAGSLVVHL